MSNTHGQETGFKRLSLIYKAIEQAALSSPWAKDPYVVLRKTKGESKPNMLPTRQALKILSKVDGELNRLAARLERESDNIWSRTRNCGQCGLKYEPLPAGDKGLCILCIMEVKRA